MKPAAARTLQRQRGDSRRPDPAAHHLNADGRLGTRIPELRAAELNNFGYELLQAGRLDEASELLRWAAELRPELSNAWDSLGEALAKQGQTEAAIAAYERSISLDIMSSNGYRMLRSLGVEKYP